VYGLPVLGIVTCDVCLEIVNLAKRQTQDMISECWQFFLQESGKLQSSCHSYSLQLYIIKSSW